MEKYSPKIYRLFEISVPALSWILITLPLWLSPFHPAVVSYFLLTFNIYFLYKSLSIVILSTFSFLKLKKFSGKNWLGLAKKLPNFSQVYHAVIIPNYKENTQKVRKTLTFLSRQDFPRKRIFVCLALEEREGEEGKKRAKILAREFREKFGLFLITFHPDLPNEVKGKASNATWAAKKISQEVRKMGLDKKFITITSCDADALLPEKYFSYLTYLFLTDKEKDYHFYWAPVLLYSNFWEVPLPVRLQATISSIMRLANLSKPENLIQISTYSLSLSMLEKIGYWDTDIIPEDWHIFLQAFFTLGEKVKTLPLYLIVSRDAVNSPRLFLTLKSRYEQEKRWAWGVTDVPYALSKLFSTPHLPFLPKLFKVLYLLETHLLWPTSFFILTLGASLPLLINPLFSRTALGHNLPRISGFILTLTTSFIFILIFIDAKSRPKRLPSSALAKTPLLFFQWILLPLVSFFFSSLPALEAHTRLLLGKRLEYKVTEKI